MKSAKLIKMLQEIDPTGEAEIILHSGEDVFCLEGVPGYYDGAYTTLVVDEERHGSYNVIGAKYRTDGTKIRIRGIDTESAIYDDPDLPVEICCATDEGKEYLLSKVDQWRKDSRDCESTAEEFMKVFNNEND